MDFPLFVANESEDFEHIEIKNQSNSDDELYCNEVLERPNILRMDDSQ